MPPLRESSVQWVKTALLRTYANGDQLEACAETLVDLAERFDVPIETLVSWLHYNAPMNDGWPTSEFYEFCKSYTA